jgi:hypothetical protein
MVLSICCASPANDEGGSVLPMRTLSILGVTEPFGQNSVSRALPQVNRRSEAHPRHRLPRCSRPRALRDAGADHCRRVGRHRLTCRKHAWWGQIEA